MCNLIEIDLLLLILYTLCLIYGTFLFKYSEDILLWENSQFSKRQIKLSRPRSLKKISVFGLIFVSLSVLGLVCNFLSLIFNLGWLWVVSVIVFKILIIPVSIDLASYITMVIYPKAFKNGIMLTLAVLFFASIICSFLPNYL